MGLRTQTLKMKFASPEIKADFLRSQFSFDQAKSKVEKMTHFIDGHEYTGLIYHQGFIGDSISMIYSPVYIKNGSIYDGILNRPLSSLIPSRAEKLTDIDNKKSWQIRFASALCPDCGWDLTGERDSVVLFCNNCDTAWHAEQGNFRKVHFGVIRPNEKNLIYLPFWKMTADIQGIKLSSFADLVKIANLPRAMKPEWQEQQLHFWSPAFKVYPKMFVRLSRQITVAQPGDDLKGILPKAGLYPVTLDSREAFESIKVTLANAAVSKRKIYPILPAVHVKPEDAVLIYMPFTKSANDYIHPKYKLSIQRNTILNLRRPGSF